MSPAENAPGDAGDTESLAADKTAIQIRLISAALRERYGTEVGIAPPGLDGGLDYLYEEGVILVRNEYMDQVTALLGEAGPPAGEPGGGDPPGGPDGRAGGEAGPPRDEQAPRAIEGVTLLPLRTFRARRALDALELIDQRLGTGVATPNHILSITPVHSCPATEPEPEPATAQPGPGPRDGGGSGVFIYLADTGLLATAHRHPWLAGVTGQEDRTDVVNGILTIPQYAGHGTFVAGVARCMAPQSQVYVTDDFTAGGALTEHEIVIRLFQALRLGADIISLSAGGTTRKDLPLLGFESFWERYRQHKNVVMVAAAGNNSSRRPFWPAAFPQVISVGALAADGRSRAYFSDFGPTVDVCAPGQDLVNAYAWGTYEYREPPHIGLKRQFSGMARWSGTSFSTPLVSGLIAARMSRTGESGRAAAQALLARARHGRVPGVGPVLRPGDADGTGDGHCRCHDGHCGCGCGAH
jgi:subtilase family protein